MDLLNDYASDDDANDNTDAKKTNDVDITPVTAKRQKNDSSSTSHTSDVVAVTTDATPPATRTIRTPGSIAPVAQRSNRAYLQAAPAVDLRAAAAASNAAATSALTIHDSSTSSGHHLNKGSSASSTLVLMNNPTKEVMYQPVYGPVLDDQKTNKKHGQAEHNVAFDETTFHEQRTAFQRTGRAVAPHDATQVVLRTTLGYDSKRLAYFAKQEDQLARNKRPRLSSKSAEADLVQGSDDEAEFGIWAPASQEEQWDAENALSDIAKGGIESLAPEQRAEREYIQERNRQLGVEQEQKEEESAFDRLVERKMAHLLPPRIGDDGQKEDPSTVFHGPQEFDYKGRSWMAPPPGLGSLLIDGDVRMDHHRCFVPKKCVLRFTGHNKGVHRIRLFPRTGHLILSAGLDGKCKIWSIEHKQVMRTYSGHSAAVRDVQFNNEGTAFVSASFDRYLRLWETETGKVLQTFSNRKVPYVVKFYPHDDNLFVVGCSDNKIVTYDCTTAEIVQEYNHHLAPVNAIVFVEEEQSATTKMVSSSDDKKILVWEWSIGVPIKIISDPSQHSMPCLVMHPSNQFFCGQSLDNTIAVFQAGSRFALQRKKKFSGHVVSGYACEMAFSPDGQFLGSGDGNGSLFFWDWKKHKILQKYRAHTAGPAICCAWHPLEPSTVFTCGWDGVIKMWQ